MSIATAEFAEESVLDILIPEATNIEVEEVLGSLSPRTDDARRSIIDSLPQRDILFFDEKISIYVFLRTPYQDELAVRPILSQLSIALEAHAVSSATPRDSAGSGPSTTSAGQARDVIWVGKVDVTEDPFIAVEESEHDRKDRDLLVIWKLNAFLSRPRIRLQAPMILFKASASLQAESKLDEGNDADPYLPSGVPLPTNLLQPLQDDPALKGGVPYLPSSWVNRSGPSARSTGPESLPIKVISRKAFRALPAISTRMRYHRENNTGTKPRIIATLEIEVPSFGPSVIELRSVKLEFIRGHIQDMVSGSVIKLPKECRPRDNIVFIYRLTPSAHGLETTGASSQIRPLGVAVDALVLVSDKCNPIIETRWKADVDFSAVDARNTRTGRTIEQASRPTSLTPSSTGKHETPTSSTLGNSGSLASSSANDLKRPLNGDLDVTVTFTSQGEPYVGEPYHWDVFVVNRSSKSRRFAMVVMPQRNNLRAYKNGLRPSSSSSDHGRAIGPTAEAAVDEQLLYATSKTHSLEPARLICLTTDLSIGPLAAGSCYSTDLKFLPLAKGPLHIDSVRIVDVSTNEAIDVRDLPDIIALERPTES